MRKRSKRRATHIVMKKRNAPNKPERITKSRVLSRARRVRMRTALLRTNAFLSAFFTQVRKGSVRAIVALVIVAAIVVGIPFGLAAAFSDGSTSAKAADAGATPEILVLDIGTRALSEGPSGEEGAGEVVPTPTPEPHPTNTVFSKGIESPVVAEIQERLMELGYMDWDEPTQLYGPMTTQAVELFQRKHDLTMDGRVDAAIYELLMSGDAKKYTVSIGDRGQDVSELQKRLQELGYINKATEYFGTETEEAVKKFQSHNGLTVDGTVGEMTREALYSEDAKANYFERGEVREEIKTYQKRLISLGYLVGEVDGVNGASTVQAVRRFQERSALIADGYLGPETIKYLMRKDAQANALMIGMKGKDVENVQNRLKELGYLKTVDGYFGSGTDTAVRSFQATNGLSVDGKVGKGTLSTLTSSKAKKYNGTSGGSSSSGGSSGGSSSGGTVTAPKGASVDTFISVAKSKLGSRYRTGGKGPDIFDCSGFVYWCLNQAGVKQGYMTSASWQKTTKYQKITSMSSLKKGDVVSFRGHVGIYLGNGQMIDASSTQGQVRITSGDIKNSSYWKKNFVCGFRIF